ncbi:G-D-S-L family lipolytic protein [hydrothermal vent metagenome]|uniref:G-D-S-L family lipolytic protein n=1 Tax=hydrothermal vent metagenome TaxID=652676 RepID=A0A3B0TV62_9ZZZZ
MKRIRLSTYILVLLPGVIFGIILGQNKTIRVFLKKPFIESYIKFDDTRKVEWSSDFEVVEIKSRPDNNIQKAYFYKSKSNKPRPLIVSLHTWSGNYNQNDKLAELCKSKGLNYIHPDFRGANFTENACCSGLALNDIDESITYAIGNANVDTSKIFVIGVSGGGYATLSTFMKSKHNIKKFSAWASISDLIAWYNESRIRKSHYAENILKCTKSENGVLNKEVAKQKSPIYWATPLNKLSGSEISIYAGIYDGIQGSVPITHSINFYNKLISDLSVTDSSKYVSDKEKLELLEYRRPLGDFGKISGRDICLIKEFKNIKLVIFEGNHEMLTEFALNELLEK